MSFEIGDDVKVLNFDALPLPKNEQEEFNMYIGLVGTVVDIIDDYESVTPIGVEFSNLHFLWFGESEIEKV